MNHDSTASVPPWDGARRVVKFNAQVNVPAVLASLIGTNSILVEDDQRFKIIEQGVIRVESCPAPQIPGASGFTSSAIVTITQRTDGCISIDGMCRCQAAGPWGLTGTIETFMAKEARTTLRHFLDFCSGYIEELRLTGAFEATLAATPRMPSVPISVETEISAPPVPEGEPGAEFYDAEDDVLSSGLIVSADGEGAAPMSIDILLLYLKYISRNGDEANQLLKSIDHSLACLVEKSNEAGRTAWWAELAPGTREMALITGVALISAAGTSLLWWMRGASRKAS